MSNKAVPTDPHARREAEKYENPIASRELILEYLEQADGPMSHRALCRALKLTDEDHIEALRRRLIAMERDGQLVSNRKGAYGSVNKMDLIRGKVQGHRDGFGFVIPTDGSDDIYVSNREMRKVFSGDEVLVRADGYDIKGRREGAIVEVLVHNTQTVVGKYFNEGGIHFVRPDNPRIGHDIMLPADQTNGAKPGQIVEAEVVRQPERRRPPSGSIKAVLGDHMAPGMEIDVAIRSYDLPHEWPKALEAEIAAYGREVEEADKLNRHDLRKLPFVTIDGEDARDFDDAVYCEPLKSGGWRLYVAIADVSHYVAVGSELDKEATSRGNSVYFPDYVLPMLPEVLSNGLCSLNPDVDRLCMVCEMTISAKGKVSSYAFFEAVMHSHARLTYTQVGKVLAERGNKNSGARKQYAKLLPQLDALHDLYTIFREQRDLRGAIDFETKETRILFDENRKIKDIVPVERNDAHKLIEECMLAANVSAAKFLSSLEVPALYRVHEGPKAEKIALLHEYLGELGLSMRGSDEVTPQDYQYVLEQIEGRPDAHIIQMVMLRSMNQAVYQADNKGHFGLAYSEYAHFTSPIRRYPDLLVHRAIRSVIRSNLDTNKVKRVEQTPVVAKETFYPYTPGGLASLGEQCSTTERRADEATRDVMSWLKCEYLQDKVGDEFEGVVSAVTGFGLFVELSDVYVEGLVHITALPQDYYHFEPARHRLVGERTRTTFKLGDSLTVRVVRVDLDERKIDFELIGAKTGRKAKPKASSKAKAMAKDYEAAQARKPRKRKPKANSPEPAAPVKKASAASRIIAGVKNAAANLLGRGKAKKAEEDAPIKKAKPSDTKATQERRSTSVESANTGEKAKPKSRAGRSRPKARSKAQPKKGAKGEASAVPKARGASAKKTAKPTSKPISKPKPGAKAAAKPKAKTKPAAKARTTKKPAAKRAAPRKPE